MKKETRMMCPGASQVFPLLLVVMVGLVAAVVGCVNHHAINQQEALLTIAINQLTLLKQLNESSDCSRDNELRELQLMKEATVEQLEGMKEQMREELQAVREMMEREVKEVLGAVRNESLVQSSQQQPQQPSQQPLRQLSQQPLQQPSQEPLQQPLQQPSQLPDLQSSIHNDTNPSLCGPHKVLYGSRGSLSPTHPEPYQSHMVCAWQVVMPEGTRPFFTWHYIDTESCDDCRCDWVTVSGRGVVRSPRMCGSSVTNSQPMYGIESNEFLVVFNSDYAHQRKGFLLDYAAVPVI